jgi:hypothetical protein
MPCFKSFPNRILSHFRYRGRALNPRIEAQAEGAHTPAAQPSLNQELLSTVDVGQVLMWVKVEISDANRLGNLSGAIAL